MAPARRASRRRAMAIPATICITSGSFHLVSRVEHNHAINELHAVSKKVVEVASQGLLIVPTRAVLS